jgi:hypothetical protein
VGALCSLWCAWGACGCVSALCFLWCGPVGGCVGALCFLWCGPVPSLCHSLTPLLFIPALLSVHSRIGGNPEVFTGSLCLRYWIPVFTGMTRKRWGMTKKETGMTKKETGMTKKEPSSHSRTPLVIPRASSSHSRDPSVHYRAPLLISATPLVTTVLSFLIPAQAGSQGCTGCWLPVFTGMTKKEPSSHSRAGGKPENQVILWGWR